MKVEEIMKNIQSNIFLNKSDLTSVFQTYIHYYYPKKPLLTLLSLQKLFDILGGIDLTPCALHPS